MAKLFNLTESIVSNVTNVISSLPSILPNNPINNLTGIVPNINISEINLPIEVKGKIDDDTFKINMMISNDLMLFIAFIGLIVGCVSLCYTCKKKVDYLPQPNLILNSPLVSPPPERELLEMLSKNSKKDNSELIANPCHHDDSVV